MRVTTNSIVRNYNFNLNTVMADRNSTAEKVYSHRKFMRASEDPAGAYEAARLHRQYLSNLDNIETVKSAQDRLGVVQSTITSIREQASKVLNDVTLSAINGTIPKEQRETYADTLEQIQQSLIKFASTNYDGQYLFSGKNTTTVPFTIADDGTVSYLGNDVSDPAAFTALEALSQDKVFLDIGMDISSGVISDANAFNISIPGINLLGYGVNDDGDPKNLIALTGELAKALRCSDEEWSNGNYEKFNNMMGQYRESYDRMVDAEAAIGVKANFLDATLERYKDMDISYQEQIEDVEYVDDAAAISDYTYAQYAYNAALRVGTSILSASLLDFLK